MVGAVFVVAVQAVSYIVANPVASFPSAEA